MRCIYASCGLTRSVRSVLCSEMGQVREIAGESSKCQKIVHWSRRKFDTEDYSLFRVSVLKKRAKWRVSSGVEFVQWGCRGICAVKRHWELCIGEVFMQKGVERSGGSLKQILQV